MFVFLTLGFNFIRLSILLFCQLCAGVVFFYSLSFLPISSVLQWQNFPTGINKVSSHLILYESVHKGKTLCNIKGEVDNRGDQENAAALRLLLYAYTDNQHSPMFWATQIIIYIYIM